MKQESARGRVLLASILLFAIVIGTAYFQSIWHFNTYLALAICMVDTIVSAIFLFSR